MEKVIKCFLLLCSVLYIKVASFVVRPKALVMSTTRLQATYPVKIIMEGEESLIDVDESRDILTGLLKAGFDAPYGCRAGLCTDCAALVLKGRDSIELEAAVLDEETTEKGFILTCSAAVTAPGVELELSVGDDMYESQYGDFRKDHESFQNQGTKSGIAAGLDAALNLNTEA